MQHKNNLGEIGIPVTGYLIESSIIKVLPMDFSNGMFPKPFARTYFHGTKADLKIGDLVEIGRTSNYGKGNPAGYVYATGTLDAAIWAAELAAGNGPERIYLVEPTGNLEDDPNVTDKKFPGNPTLSYRSKHPLTVVGEITVWRSHGPEALNLRRIGLAKAKERGIEATED